MAPTTDLTIRLQRLREELRARARLAALDARAAWDRAHLERVGDELAAARDEARLQAHLGSMDARDAWARVESELRSIAGRSGAAADEAVATIARALSEILDGPRGREGSPSEQAR